MLVEATLCGLSIFLVLYSLLVGGVERAADVFALVAVFLVGVALLGLVERLDSLLYDLAGRMDDVLRVLYWLSRFETSEAGDTEAYMALEEWIRSYERGEVARR